MKRVMRAEMGGVRPRGSLRMRWKDVIKRPLENGRGEASEESDEGRDGGSETERKTEDEMDTEHRRRSKKAWVNFRGVGGAPKM